MFVHDKRWSLWSRFLGKFIIHCSLFIVCRSYQLSHDSQPIRRTWWTWWRRIIWPISDEWEYIEILMRIWAIQLRLEFAFAGEWAKAQTKSDLGLCRRWGAYAHVLPNSHPHQRGEGLTKITGPPKWTSILFEFKDPNRVLPNGIGSDLGLLLVLDWMGDCIL